ncbi:MAG: hypothetical protein MJ227_00395 [Bacilli bacterium]|nr:hypothetical protein [Bacilli bacterium]
MAKAKRVARCYHCGAILQSENKNEEGFISKEFTGENTPKIPYCNKCYEKMQSLNSGYLDLSVQDDVLKVLKDANATDAYIIWVVDLFSFNGTINPEIAKSVKKLNVCVVGTKRDLFSRTIKNETFERYLNETFTSVGIKPVKVLILGNEDSWDTDTLYKKLQKVRQGHDVYMIGSLQSGKTTLINKMLKSYKNKTKWNVNSEFYPDTNLKVLEIPFDNSSFFYELPGWPLATSIVSKVEKELAKFIIPRKKIHPTLRTLARGESILLGGLAAYSLVKGRSTAIKLYCSGEVENKKVPTSKLTEIMRTNYHKRILRPVSDRFNDFSDYDLFEYEMENDNQVHDISIEGLCWISFIGRGQTIRVMLPKGCALKESLAKIR